MSGFLSRMARSSAARARRARACESEPALRRRALDGAPPARLVLSPLGFDLLAEIKRRSPAAGRLAGADVPAAARGQAYAAAGAAALSVLTEPEAFDGSLADLREVAAAAPVPVLRKDFLVDPYQIFEARAAGAAGALLVLRLLDDALLSELIDAAAEAGLFLLLEAFDVADAERARAVALQAQPARVLCGANARDLDTLGVEPERLVEIGAALPRERPRVAESGMLTPADVRRAAGLGYRAALVGSALMNSDDPGRLAAEMLRAGREEAQRACACE